MNKHLTMCLFSLSELLELLDPDVLETLLRKKIQQIWVCSILQDNSVHLATLC